MPEESLTQFQTNFFGGVNVARAFLPSMRKEKTGTVVWIGSILGWAPLLGIGMYSATKAAMRAMSQTLDAEISPLGLRSINVDFGWFRTEACTPANMVSYTSRIADYDASVGPVGAQIAGFNHIQPGDPVKGAEIIMDLVRGEGVAEGKQVPSVIGLGPDYYAGVKQACEARLEDLEVWREVTCSTDISQRQRARPGGCISSCLLCTLPFS